MTRNGGTVALLPTGPHQLIEQFMDGGKKTMKGFTVFRRAACWGGLLLLCPALALAQGTSPWVDAVNVLQTTFTGPIARGLSLVAIVAGGLLFAFGERQSKRAMARIVFGARNGHRHRQFHGLAVSTTPTEEDE